MDNNPVVYAPSVTPLNALGADWAANDFMHYMTGLGRPASGFRILRANGLGTDGLHADPGVQVD